MYEYLLALLLIITCGFRLMPTRETDEQVMKVADSQMGSYLAKMEPGKETDYGFTEQDDLDACVVGKPYRIMEFNNAFYYDAPQERTDYINIKNKWLVPISLNHQYKAFLTIDGNPGNLNVTAMGSAALAKEVQLLSMGVKEADDFYILKVPLLAADFFVHESDNSFSEARFVPLETAYKNIPSLSSKKEEYTLTEIQKIIKESLAAGKK